MLGQFALSPRLSGGQDAASYAPVRQKLVRALGNIIVAAIFIRWWLFWNTYLAFPLTSRYNLHISEVIVFAAVGGLLALRVHLDQRFLKITKLMLLLLPAHWALAVAVNPFDTVPVMELAMSLLYTVGPCLVGAALPPVVIPFVGKLLRVTLWWYAVQVVLGAAGLLHDWTGVLSLSMGQYGELLRPRTTFAVNHLPFMLLVAHLHVNDQRQRANQVVTFVTMGALLLSLQRGAWLDLALLVFVGLFAARDRRLSRLRAWTVGLVLPVILLSSPLWFPAFRDRFTESAESDERRQEHMTGQRTELDGNGRPGVEWIGTGTGTCYVRSATDSGLNPLLGSWQLLPGDRWQDLMYSAAPHNLYVALYKEMGVFCLLVLYVFGRWLVLPVLRRRNIVSWGLIAALLIYFNLETNVLAPHSGFGWILMCWLGLHAAVPAAASVAQPAPAVAEGPLMGQTCPDKGT